ncbi:MAG: DUF3782 domain-containing protein [Nitrospirae bacterium]|nr:DUF3782 domain-containing protein [Nitrospirota bacterium]
MYATEDRLDRLEAIVEQQALENAQRARQMEEWARQMNEWARQMNEWARQMNERTRQAAEDTWQMKEAMRISSEKVDAQLAKTDAQLAKTDAQLAKTEKLVAKTTEAVNKLTGKWSNFVVGLVFPAVERMFQERGIDLKRVRKGVYVEAADVEIDIFGINGQYVVAIEIKSTLSVADVNEHLARLSKLQQAFKGHADKQIIGAVAGIVIEEGVDRYAYHKGLFVIGESGNTVKILNDSKFVPRHF